MKTLFCALFGLISFGLFGQSGSYEVVESNNVTNIEEYESAMDKADFDAYRYVAKRRVLQFDSGVVIELLSVEELEANGVTVDRSKAKVFDPNMKESSYVWKLAPNGYIIQQFEYSGKSKSRL